MIYKIIGVLTETDKALLTLNYKKKERWIPKSVILGQRFRNHQIELDIKNWYCEKVLDIFVPSTEFDLEVPDELTD